MIRLPDAAAVQILSSAIQLHGAGGVMQWGGACSGENQLSGSPSEKKGHPTCSPALPYHMMSWRPFPFAQALKASLTHSHPLFAEAVGT